MTVRTNILDLLDFLCLRYLEGKSIWTAPLWILIAVHLMCLPSPALYATTVPLLSFDQIVDQAELIVEGTVKEIKSDWSDDQTTVYTYVTLDNITQIHGIVEAPELILRFQGGTVDEYTLTVPGIPTFSLREKAILFVRGNDRAVSSIVGFFQGRFRIVDDHVFDHAGLEIVGITNDRFIKVPTSANAAPDENRDHGISAGKEADGQILGYEPLAAGGPNERENREYKREGSTPPPTMRPQRRHDSTSRAVPPPDSSQVDVTVLSTPETAPILIDPEDDDGARMSRDDFIRAVQARIERKRK